MLRLLKFKKFFGSMLLVAFLSALIFAPVARAQGAGPWYDQDFVQWYTKVYDEDISPQSEIFGERYTAAQVQWIFWSLISLPINFVGSSNREAVSCLMKGLTGTVDLSDCVGAINNTIRNLLDFIPSINIQASTNDVSPVALIFNREDTISGVGYIKSLMEKFTLVSKVGAQGFGYRNLNVLQRYWSGFRDMAYALMIIPIIVLAFMIMFRVKISPQVVISVQSALPKIFVALLLATFSFAIAGFMIDLMYVVAGLFASLLNLGGLAGNFRDAYEAITFVKISGVVGGFAILFNLLAYTVMFLLSAVISFIPTIVGGLFGALASLFAIVITVWLVLLALWYTIKIPWVLIKTLISIYFSVLLAPIMIVGGIIIPSIGFGPWLRRLAADLLVFPTTGLTIYFAWMTLWFSFEINGRMLRLDFLLPNGGLWGNNPGSLWAPPLIGSSDNMTGLLFLFMSFGIIAVTPKIAEFVKAAVMGERIAFGTAMGEAVSPLQAAWGATGAPIVGETRRYGALRGTEWALTALRTRTPLGRFQVVQKAQESAQKQRESYEEGR